MSDPGKLDRPGAARPLQPPSTKRYYRFTISRWLGTVDPLRALRRTLFCAALLAGLLGSAAARDLRLATTTSTENSGLLRVILPQFEAKHHVAVQVIAVGTGKALKLGENGDADVLLVHAPAAELAFMAAGHGVDRRKVMHNDFILVGPAADPAGVHGTTDVTAAFGRIADKKAKFISRGDNSGTDQMEKSYWPLAGVSPSGQAWYLSAGLGMGEVLTMAAELQAYTLTDRGTFAAYRAKGGLQIVVDGDPLVVDGKINKDAYERYTETNNKHMTDQDDKLHGWNKFAAGMVASASPARLAELLAAMFSEAAMAVAASGGSDEAREEVGRELDRLLGALRL